MKQCFKLKLSKEQSLRILKKAENGPDYRREKRNYYCDKCNAWHTTSKDFNDAQTKDIIPIHVNRWAGVLIPKDELPEYKVLPILVKFNVNPLMYIFK